MELHTKLACLWLLFSLAAGATLGRAGENTAGVGYGPPVQLATVKDPAIEESSGLARCHSRDDAVWTHNDSGDGARLFLIDVKGRTLGTALVDGVDPLDWEDMCSFRRDGKNYLLIGDIGDNRSRRSDLTLCLVEEPDARAVAAPTVWHLQPTALIRLQLEGGARDVESLAVDASDGAIYLASKSLLGDCQIFQMAWDWASVVRRQAAGPQLPPPPLIAKRIAAVAIPLTTGMDISADGRRAAIVSYAGAYEFARREGETWAVAFARPPHPLPLPVRKQGEAICYGADDRSLYLTSEGRCQPLWLVPCRGVR
jgi:hypothetical protein